LLIAAFARIGVMRVPYRDQPIVAPQNKRPNVYEIIR
jgi:hypothetical protein